MLVSRDILRSFNTIGYDNYTILYNMMCRFFYQILTEAYLHLTSYLYVGEYEYQTKLEDDD